MNGASRKAESCVQIHLRLSQNASDLKTEIIAIWRFKMQSQGLSSVYVPRNFKIAPRILEISNLRNYL